MAGYFPLSELPVHVSIAPGADPQAGVDAWDTLWTDITTDVQVDEGITIEAGRPDEADQVDPSQLSLTLDNRLGHYSPRNPLGQWYGALRKNCPIKVEIDLDDDVFDRTVTGGWGTSTIGRVWSFSNTASATWAVTPGAGTFTYTNINTRFTAVTPTGSWNSVVRTQVSLGAVPSGGGYEFGVSQRHFDAQNNWLCRVFFRTTGAVDAEIVRRDAGTYFSVDSALGILTYTGVEKLNVEAQTAGPTIRAKFWWDGTPKPAAWTVSFTEPNPALTILGHSGGRGKLGTGTAFVIVRQTGNTNNATITFHSWSMRTPLFVGNVVEWPVRWDQSGNQCLVPLAASGVMRRLQQGQSPLRSPLYRTLASGNPFAYWPFEDESGAVQAAGIGASVQPATAYSADFGGWPGVQLAGATSTVEINQDTTLAGTIPVTASSTGWTMVGFVNIAGLVTGPPYTLPLQVRSSGTAERWQVQADASLSGTLYLVALDPANTQLVNIAFPDNLDVLQWVGFMAEVKPNGANVDVTWTTVRLDTGAIALDTETYAGVTGMPKTWTIYGSSTTFASAAFGHLAFFQGTGLFTGAQLLASARGYAGESASDRAKRLCAEFGVPCDDLGDSTTIMGPQATGTFLELLHECETTDLALLYEMVHDAGVSFLPRPSRVAATPFHQLNFANGDVSRPPEPTDDDQALRNDWTVSRSGGSSAQVVDSGHIAEHGLYDDSVTINVSTDDVLADHAGLRVHLGTSDDLRWPQVEMNLAKRTNLMNLVPGWTPGTQIRLNGPPSQLPENPIDVVVEGYTHTLSTFGWETTLNCSPAAPWTGFSEAADPVAADTWEDRRAESVTSTLGSSITSSATSITVVHPSDSAAWNTNAAEYTPNPMAILVGGERMNVTAVSGAGTSQTFTVTRAVNGVTKAHSSGEQVVVALSNFAAL